MSDFPTAVAALEGAGDSPASFVEPFLELLPITGAAISTLGELLGSETIAASDERAARLDELQFDLSEGPCWDALRTARPVLETDLLGHGRDLWPAFSAASAGENVRSIFAYPLIVGSLRVGAIEMYSLAPATLNISQSRQAGIMAEIVGRHVLRRALAEIGSDYDDTGNAYSRRLIHQATGMVLAQLDVSADDARLIIQGHAFASDSSMMDVAREILDGNLSFSRQAQGFESFE